MMTRFYFISSHQVRELIKRISIINETHTVAKNNSCKHKGVHNSADN